MRAYTNISNYKINIYFIILFFAASFLYSQTATVSGGATASVNGIYTKAGTTNVNGTDRDYYDLPSSTMRLEYRNNPSYGIEWEIWESTARGGGGTVRYYNLSNSITPPSAGWAPDVASLPAPTVAFVLPVELTSFNALVSNNNVKLNWQTATELNNYGFEIERKVNNSSNWNKIGFVEGNGNSNTVHNYSFTDLPTGGTNFMYRLKQVDNNGNFEYSPEVNVILEIPQVFTVKQNFPNPFNPTTKIEYSIPEDNNVQVKIYNAIGMEITTILNEFQQAGKHNVTFNAANFSSGIYFYKITNGNYSQIKKMVLLR